MKVFVSIILILSVVLLVVFLTGDGQAPPKQTESQSADHVYTSWDTMELDKCMAAWLIVRFIDKDAKFVFYPQGTEISQGVVFDVPGAEWSRKHRKCTSDCILESLEINDPAVERVVAIAHQTELNFWQLDRFPEAQKCLNKVREMIDAADNPLECFEKTRLYFDKLYDDFRKE